MKSFKVMRLVLLTSERSNDAKSFENRKFLSAMAEMDPPIASYKACYSAQCSWDLSLLPLVTCEIYSTMLFGKRVDQGWEGGHITRLSASQQGEVGWWQIDCIMIV